MAQPTDENRAMQVDERADLVDQILDEALSGIRNGQPLVLEAYCQRFPEVADELRLMLPAMLLMENPGLLMENPGLSTENSATTGQPAKWCSKSTTQSPTTKPPILNDYAIVAEIGRGAMGVVYEAIQLPLNRRVALKVLFETATSDEKYYRRFVREAEIASRLHHTNIIPVFEAGQSEGCCFYAMQLIEGKNLLQLIQASDRSASERQSSPTLDVLATYEETATQSGNSTIANELRHIDAFRTPPSTNMIESPTVCAGWALQVADGLHFAHQRGILHRDVKPSNIIVDCEQRAWIADFGLAKAQEDAGLTEDHDVVGTIRYLAPERFQGRCDQRSDVYALGVTLYEVLHQRPYWLANSRAQLVQQIVNNRYGSDNRRPYSCPRDLQRIIEKATAHEPDRRYPHAGALAEDLRRFLDGRPVMARKPSALYKAYRWARRNPLAAALTSILFLVVTVAATVTASLSFRASQLSAQSLENFENAKRNMGFLLETIDQVCLSLGQDQRLNRPEFIGLRQQLLQMVIAFNDQFEQLPDVASEMHFLSAKAQTRLGSMTSGDDTLEESAGYLESARTVLLEMHRNAPDRDELSLELARCLRATANVEWRMGIREIAFERNAHATRLCEYLRGVQGVEFEAEVELARNRLALGGYLSEAGARDEAENHILQAIEILEKMHEDRANDRSLALELGHAYRQQGQYYLANLRHWRKAEVPLERAAELYHLADAEEPGNPDLAANLARTLSLQAKLCYIGNHRQQAVEYLERTCAILVELVSDHGNVADYRALYANSLQRLAEYNILLDPKSHSILSNLEQAVQEYTWLIACDPDHIAYKKGLISTRVDQAELLMLQSEWQHASSCIDSAMMIVDELAYLEPIDRFIQEQKHFLFCKKAELLANVQRFEDSLAAWDQAIHLAPDGFREINRIQRLRTVVLSGDFTDGVAELERLLTAVDDQTKGRQHYWGSAARVFALAHQQVVQSPNSGNLEELAEGYARRALQMMTDLLALEMFNLEFTESSPDYNSLRDRADFKAILEEARRRSSTN